MFKCLENLSKRQCLDNLSKRHCLDQNSRQSKKGRRPFRVLQICGTGEALVGEAGLEASLKTSNLTRKNGQALLCDELKKAKEDKDNAKKAAKQAAKVEKNCLKRRARLLKARHGSFRSGGLLSPNIPPNNGPLHTPQVTFSCFASECSVVPQAAKGLSKEDIQLLLTAKEADNTGD